MGDDGAVVFRSEAILEGRGLAEAMTPVDDQNDDEDDRQGDNGNERTVKASRGRGLCNRSWALTWRDAGLNCSPGRRKMTGYRLQMTVKTPPKGGVFAVHGANEERSGSI